MDRAVANKDWIEKFPASSVSHVFSHASNHIPILLRIMNDRRLKGRGASGFKFKESWLLWDDCKETVLEVWTKGGQGSPGLSRVRDRIQGCGVDLQVWGSSKTKFETDEIK